MVWTAATCTNLAPLATNSAPCTVIGGRLYCNACPLEPSKLERCPWLCTTPFAIGSAFACSKTNTTDPFGKFPCRKCLSACNTTKAIASFSPSSTKSPGLTTGATVDKTTKTAVTAACTSAKPFGSDPPPVQAIENRILYSYRFSCGASAATVVDCPYLCNRGPSNHTLRLCNSKDVSDPISIPLESRLVCERCSRPSGPTHTSLIPSTSASPSATCTSISPTGNLCSVVKHKASSASNGSLFQSHCGTSLADLADCPFLCTTVDPAYVDLLRCVNEDVSGKNTIFDEYHIESCMKCLPACSHRSQ